MCLSLLGTWAGPGWVPGTSTLSQVLLSIQGQILVEVRACMRGVCRGRVHASGLAGGRTSHRWAGGGAHMWDV